MLDTNYLHSLSPVRVRPGRGDPPGSRTPVEPVGRVRELAAEASALGRAIELEGHSRVSKTHLARRLGEIDRLQIELREVGSGALDRSLQRTESTLRFALELWKNRRSNALEWAIVALIVVDILVARL